MESKRIGAFLSSFRLGVKESLKKAQDIGIGAIQLSDVGKELIVEQLSSTGINEIKNLFQSYGLKISSVCGDLGGHEFTNKIDVEERIIRTKKIMDITLSLGCSIVQTHIGTIPEDFNSKETEVMKYALDILGKYGDSIGCCLATETGPESPELMYKFLNQIKHKSIKVNYDPANLAMNGFDQIKGVKILKDYIVHTHAKDGKKGVGELPLGKGDVNFPVYLNNLQEIGYNGYFIIEREVGEDPVTDIVEAKKFLEKLI